MQKTLGGGGGGGGGERGRCFFPSPPLLQIARVCFTFTSPILFESLAQAIRPGGIDYYVAISKS